jgi:hypothetical protein
VLGAVVYDKGGGLQAAFLLQTAINTVALLLALLVVSVWLWAGSSSSSSSSRPCSPRLFKADLQLHRSDTSESDGTEYGQPRLPVVEIVLKDAAPAAAADDDDDYALSDSWQLTVVTSAANAAACTTCAELHSGVCHHRDTVPAGNALRCIDSAYDVEAVHGKASTAAAAAATAKGKDSGQAQVEHPMRLAAAQQQQQQQRLDMASVLSTVCDWVVGSHCLLVFLEQALTSTMLVVIPVVMATPTWLVGVVYVAMVSVCWEIRTVWTVTVLLDFCDC